MSNLPVHAHPRGYKITTQGPAAITSGWIDFPDMASLHRFARRGDAPGGWRGLREVSRSSNAHYAATGHMRYVYQDRYGVRYVRHVRL